MHSSAIFKVHTVAKSAAVDFFFIVFLDHPFTAVANPTDTHKVPVGFRFQINCLP